MSSPPQKKFFMKPPVPKASTSNAGQAPRNDATLIPLKKLPLKRVRNYRLGPIVGNSPVKCIEQYLARKDGSDEFYIIKILSMKNEKLTMDDIQGRNLIHTEHALLSLLKEESGVLREHGLFRETLADTFVTPDGKEVKRDMERVCLILDCYMSHDYNPRYSKIVNMQKHVVNKKKLRESEAVRVLYCVAVIVEKLHNKNVVHRDLKLGNIIVDHATGKVTLTNFCLSKILTHEKVLLTDQRGSPAYVSPEIISGEKYLGKPADVWALGVILYTMIYGQFPFFDNEPLKLFKKIKAAKFEIPNDVFVTEKTLTLLKAMLNPDPSQRLTISTILEKLGEILRDERAFMTDPTDQAVPVVRIPEQ